MLDALVRVDKGDQRLPDALTAIPLVDDHIAEPIDRRIVRHTSRKANLLSRVIHAEVSTFWLKVLIKMMIILP